MIKKLVIENIYNLKKNIEIKFNNDINILIGKECTFKTSILEYIYKQENNALFVDYLNHIHKKECHIKINYVRYYEVIDELFPNFNSIINNKFSYSQIVIIDLLYAASHCGSDHILLIDNIEKFLNIDQQRNIINNIKKITDCQIICSTQSPTIYYHGWLNKVIRMEQVIKENKCEK